MKVYFETTKELREFLVDFYGEGYTVALAFDGKHNELTYEEFKKESGWFEAPLAVEFRR